MILTVLAIIEIFIFLALSLLHFYWALSPNDEPWGFSKSLPTNAEGERLLNPRKIDSAIVGFGLWIFAVFYILKAGFMEAPAPAWLLNYAGYLIAGIFILRALGDFKHVGFFKSIKNTDFARLDSRFYSPLCLTIGLVGIFIETM